MQLVPLRNGKVWVQANKSKKESLADLLDYRDVAEGRAVGYRNYSRAAAANPLGQVGGAGGVMGGGGGGGVGMIMGGGGGEGGGRGAYDAGGYQQQPQQQQQAFQQQQFQQWQLHQQQLQRQFPQQQQQQQQQQQGSVLAQLSSAAGGSGGGVVGTEREVLAGFHKYLESLEGDGGGGKEAPGSPEQLLHMLTRYVEDRKAMQHGMSGMLADTNGAAAAAAAAAGVAGGGGTGWDAAGQALIAKLRRQMDPSRAAAADQSGAAVGAVQPMGDIVGGQDPMVDDAVRWGCTR
jgi:hypothetical protein